MKKFGQWEILKRHDLGNACEVELPVELNISLVFKILGLIEYYKVVTLNEVTEV